MTDNHATFKLKLANEQRRYEHALLTTALRHWISRYKKRMERGEPQPNYISMVGKGYETI